MCTHVCRGMHGAVCTTCTPANNSAKPTPLLPHALSAVSVRLLTKLVWSTAGVLAGVFGTAATGYILKHGTWDEVWGVAVALYLVGALVWNAFSTGAGLLSAQRTSFYFLSMSGIGIGIAISCMHALSHVYVSLPSTCDIASLWVSEQHACLITHTWHCFGCR